MTSTKFVHLRGKTIAARVELAKHGNPWLVLEETETHVMLQAPDGVERKVKLHGDYHYDMVSWLTAP